MEFLHDRHEPKKNVTNSSLIDTTQCTFPLGQQEQTTYLERQGRKKKGSLPYLTVPSGKATPQLHLHLRHDHVHANSIQYLKQV